MPGSVRDSLNIRRGTVTVLSSTPATLIAPLSPTRVRLTIQNESTVNAVWLGNSGVIASQGARVIAGATGVPAEKVLVTKAAVYGIADPASQAVTYLEELE